MIFEWSLKADVLLTDVPLTDVPPGIFVRIQVAVCGDMVKTTAFTQQILKQL